MDILSLELIHPKYIHMKWAVAQKHITKSQSSKQGCKSDNIKDFSDGLYTLSEMQHRYTLFTDLIVTKH